jgi:spore coat protein U-like protein
MKCTPSVSLSMAVDGGRHADGGRHLQAEGGESRLAYALYRDVGFSQELAIDQPYPVNFSGSGPITHSIFGRVMLPGERLAGTYSDTVVVTLSW